MIVKYDHNLDNPELIEMCVKCQQPDCDGLCLEYRVRYREINGLPPLPEYLTGEGKPKKRRKRQTKYTVGDRTDTLLGWSKYSGVPRGALEYRVRKRGMSMEQALAQPWHKPGRTEYYYQCGGQMMTISEISYKYNIPRSTLYSNFEKGMTADEAVERALMRRNRNA